MKSLKDLKKENIQDLPQIVLMLKDAFCEEMLAHYQYIILADFVEGVDEPLLKKIVADFKENAKEELEEYKNNLYQRMVNSLNNRKLALKLKNKDTDK